MGYNLHITRAGYWGESEQYPIGWHEWVEAARRHPEIELAPPPAEGAGVLTGADGATLAYLTWSAGKITIRHGSDEGLRWRLCS